MLATYHSEIEQIARSIFSTMLGVDVERVEESPPRVEDAYAASVQITGAWVGGVVLEMSVETCRAAAAAMLQMPLDDVSEADQQDVSAELVNMIGGNLKSLLPGPSFLSIPTIVTGRDFGMRMYRAELVDDVTLNSEFGRLQIRLYATLLGHK